MTPYDLLQLKKQRDIRLKELSILSDVHLERAEQLDRLAAEFEAIDEEYRLAVALFNRRDWPEITPRPLVRMEIIG